MKLFEKVEATLTTLAEKPGDESTRRKRYRATSALVGGMKNYVHDDAFINALLEALTLDAQSSVAQEEIREIKFDAGVSEREAPPPKPSAGGKVSQSSSFDLAPVADQAAAWFARAAQAQERTELNLAGVAVDVFYCTRATDDLGNAARKDRAKVVYDRLLNVGSRGRLRLRELPEIVNKRTGYDVKANQVRYDPGSESKVAEDLAAWANRFAGARPFKPYAVTETPTPGYVSIFVCS